MNTRLRFIAALLALLTLTASLAEQAWALGCAGMASSAGSVADPHEVESGHGSHRPSEPSDSGHDPDAGAETSAPVPCPMAMASGMSCGVSGLRPTTVATPVGEVTHSVAPPASDDAPISVSPSSLFRPPRA